MFIAYNTLSYSMDKFVRKLIEVEIRLGFLNIPVRGLELMPSEKQRIKIVIDGKEEELLYNPVRRRIYGLTKFYRKHNMKPKDEIIFYKVNGKYKIEFRQREIITEEQELKAAEKLLDLSGLSSLAKGNIVEDRIKELLLLHGQGLLNVYKPVSDIEGIDLIVVKNGEFHPIFLQVKGNFKLFHGKLLIMQVNKKTFTPHNNYYVVGAFFNPKTLELHDYLILVPSKIVAKKGSIVKHESRNMYRIISGINDSYKGKWAKYLIKKQELADALLAKFEEIRKHYKD